jgi:RNase P subunit RPR2
MNKKTSKTQAKEKIDQFFSNINSKTPKDVKKIKKIAMSHNLKLKEKKKLFCKKCLTTYLNPKTRIKKNVKTMVCGNCNYVSRWKIKTF